jgi:hypothetical protein
MEPNAKFSRLDGPLLSDHTSYRRLVGCLLYLTITQPNLAYSVQTLSQLMDQEPHMDAAHRVLDTSKIILVRDYSTLLHLIFD